MIESLSYSKLNVFHWHLSDSQSFPLQLPSLPDFSVWGAYSPAMVYTQADIKDLQAMGRKSEVVKRVRNQLLA